MSRRKSATQNRLLAIFRSLLVFIIAAGLFGCDAIPTPNALSPVNVTCTPESDRVNIYRVVPQSWAGVIFEMAHPAAISTAMPSTTAMPPSADNLLMPSSGDMILGARYAALQQLISEANRWSDTETIKLDDSSRVRVTLTFVSPELLQAVFLNQVLKDGFLTSGFQDQLQNMLNNVAERNELLFLMTIAASNSGLNPTRHTIKVPINKLQLNNAENLLVNHSHDDHNLEQLIDTTAEPVFGYIAYPLTQLSSGECKWVLDPKYNTNIVMTLPYIEVDGASNNTPNSWTIPYVSLIAPITPGTLPVPFVPANFDINFMTPLSLPPSEFSQPNYQQDFARFIWSEITGGY